MALAQALAPIVDLIYPPRCPLCGDGITAQIGLCSACWAKLAIPGMPCCTLCSRPFDDGTASADMVCAPCLADTPRHDGVAAGTLYNDTSRALVLALKHGGQIKLAPMMARLIAAKLDMVEPDWLVVPVPLHRWRLWRRGFNQSALIAREIARMQAARLCVDGLIRLKQTPVLGGLGSKARSRVLSGAIAVNPERQRVLTGQNVVLVDDVLTSGATSGACVSALKRAGTRMVIVACFARVLDEALDVV